MDKYQNITPERTEENIRRAEELYEEGKLAWKKGDRGRAMSLYAEAAELDPDGPGAHALEMSRDIMDFFDPSQLNP